DTTTTSTTSDASAAAMIAPPSTGRTTHDRPNTRFSATITTSSFTRNTPAVMPKNIVRNDGVPYQRLPSSMLATVMIGKSAPIAAPSTPLHSPSASATSQPTIAATTRTSAP